MTQDISQITLNLKQIFREVFDDDALNIDSQTSAQNIEEWDSLAHIRLIVAIEKFFNLRFSSYEMSGIKNVGEMISLIYEKKLAN